MIIQEGAYVRDKKKHSNGGLQMYVEEVNNDEKKALCTPIGSDGVWFDFDDLVVVKEAETTFKNEGE